MCQANVMTNGAIGKQECLHTVLSLSKFWSVVREAEPSEHT